MTQTCPKCGSQAIGETLIGGTWPPGRNPNRATCEDCRWIGPVEETQRKTWTGILLEWGKPTPTNRIYSREVCEKMVEDFKARQPRSTMGTLGIPEDSLKPALSEMSHLVTAMRLIDNPDGVTGAVEVDVEILSTPRGKVLREVLASPGWEKIIAITPCGTGTLYSNDDGVHRVSQDYRLHLTCFVQKLEG